MTGNIPAWRLSFFCGKISQKDLELTKQLFVSYQTFRELGRTCHKQRVDMIIAVNGISRLPRRVKERIDFTQTMV